VAVGVEWSLGATILFPSRQVRHVMESGSGSDGVQVSVRK